MRGGCRLVAGKDAVYLIKGDEEGSLDPSVP